MLYLQTGLAKRLGIVSSSLNYFFCCCCFNFVSLLVNGSGAHPDTVGLNISNVYILVVVFMFFSFRLKFILCIRELKKS